MGGEGLRGMGKAHYMVQAEDLSVVGGREKALRVVAGMSVPVMVRSNWDEAYISMVFSRIKSPSGWLVGLQCGETEVSQFGWKKVLSMVAGKAHKTEEETQEFRGRAGSQCSGRGRPSLRWKGRLTV